MAGHEDGCSGSFAADLLLFGKVVNVYTGSISESYVGTKGGRVSYLGTNPISSKNLIKLDSEYIVPGYIDGHVHIESSLMTPSRFAETVVPRGTCCIVADPHEIANVRGVDGIRFMMHNSLKAQLRVYFMIPSCVPATHLETSGAEIGLKEIKKLRRLRLVLGLGEVMNFRGVINRDKAVLEKIKACRGMVLDGHAPGLRSEELCAYVSAGMGSDHESVSEDEAREKLSLGMWIMIREGSTAKNLSALTGIVSKGSPERVMLVTDDRHAEDLLTEGHMDDCLRKAVEEGIDPIDAVRMATLKPAEYFGLSNQGGIAPGKWADIVVLNNLEEFKAKIVLIGGKVVAKDGRYLALTKKSLYEESMMRTVNVREMQPKDFRIPCHRKESRAKVTARVIGLIQNQIVTEELRCEMEVRKGEVQTDLERDILKICVVERHRGTGRIGKGFVKGFGLNEGALASTIAHDCHNIVAVGSSNAAICIAANRLREMGGGIIIAGETGILKELRLPIAGLMTTLDASSVSQMTRELKESSATLGCQLRDPFMSLSFLTLPVIPKLKITDYGLIDVNKNKVVDLFV